MDNKVSDARMFAAIAHMGQKYGTQAYTYHLQMVYEILVDHHYDDVNTLAAAWLHDVVEDTSVPLRDIRGLFGMKVAEIVDAVTDPPKVLNDVWLNRKARKEIVYKKLQVAVPEARAVKLADRLANVRATRKEGQDSLFKMYKDEHPRFKEMLHRGGEHLSLWTALENALGER